jgi:hypothetical protein
MASLSGFCGWANRIVRTLKNGQPKRRRRNVGALTSLEDRRLLSGLIGIDFGNGGTTPTNWRQINTLISNDQFNLSDETGVVTGIDLHIEFDSQHQDGYTLFLPPAGEIPSYSKSLAGIERAFSDKGNVTMTYSNLVPNAVYDLYVFGGNDLAGNQRVTITGSGSISFDQPHNAHQLIVNDQPGDSSTPLANYAKQVQASANGEITVRVDNSPNPTSFFGIAGMAIQKSSAITASVVVADTTLATGETSQVTITFSEAVTGFTNADLNVPNATLSPVSSSDGGMTWTATLTPNVGVQDSTNVITLDRSGVTGASGAGSGTTTSNNYAIDTLGPTLTITVADNALGAGETSPVTFAFNEPVTGFTLSDISVDNGTLSALTTLDGGQTWTAVLTPTPGVTDASNLIQVDTSSVADLVGNVGAATVIASNNYAIDVVGPRTLSIVVSDATLLAGETCQVRFTFSEAVNGLTNADITVENGVLGSLTTIDNITWTGTLTPTADLFDTTNVITLDNTGYTDRSSNTGLGTSTSNNYAVQTVRPTSSITVADTMLVVGEASLVTFTFSEIVLGFTNTDLTVDNGAVGPLATTDGGMTWTGLLTPTANINDTTNAVRLLNTRYTNVQGNTGLGTTVSNNYVIDTTRPSAVITIADRTLLVGETSLVTFAFNDAVTGFTNADITVENGTLSNVVSGDGGLTFTATLTPTNDITDTSNLITVNNTGVVDLAGNVGVGVSTSLNYAIDTQRPTVAVVLVDSTLTIGETSLVTFTFNEPVTGFSNPDTRVEGGLLSPVSSGDGGRTWTATFTPTGNLQDILNVVSVILTGVQDVSGNIGAGTTVSSNYVVDTLRPTTVSINVADSDIVVGETSLVTFTFSEAITAFTNADLTVPNGTLSPVSSSDGGVNWTATFTPTRNVVDLTNVIVLTNTGITDVRGNAGVGSTSSNNFTITSNQPTVSIVVADSVLTIGETSLVTFTFSSPVTGFTNADLTVANGTLSPVTTSDGGLTYTATFTPNAGVTDSTNLIISNNSGFVDGSLVAGVGTTSSNNYAIDQVRPVATTIVLSDTALVAGETALVTVTFSEAVTGFSNSDLTIPNGTLSAVASVDGGVTWKATYTPSANTTDATNLIVVNNAGYTDLAGNAGTGTASSGNYTIDTLRPTATIVVSDTQLGIGEVSLVTVTFNEAVTGFTKADLTVSGGTISTLETADGGITWTGTLTPSPGTTLSGNVISLNNTGFLDASGNTGTGSTNSNSYSVDTVRPTASISLSDTTLTVGQTALVTITFSEAVTGFSNADLTLPNGSLSAVSSANGGVIWTATLTPAVNFTDPTNFIGLNNTGYTDLTGNTGLGSTNSANYVIDTQRPTATVTLSDAALRIGETALVTITFSEPVINFTNADLTVPSGILGPVTTVNQGATWTATFTPTIDITDTSNVITLNNAGSSDPLGNVGIGTTSSANYVVDTVRPTATIVVSDTSLLYGETSLVTFTFSEAVTGFSNADLTIANGTLSAVTTGNGGVTWTATLTPTVGIQALNNTIVLNNAGYTDTIGNAGTGTKASNTYSINTIADDFGDLPDSYRTLLANDGPRHRAGSLFLGSGITIESNGQPSPGANADTDDGVTVPGGLIAGVDGLVRVTASQSGRLDAFIDFNNNGVFDVNERVTPAGGLNVVAGSNDLRFVIPQDAANGGHAARFRLSSVGALAPTGAALDGEVEDYLLTITNPAVGTVQSVADPARPGDTMLLIKGTTGDDTISIAKSGSGNVVTLKGVKSPVLAATSRIVVFGLAGKDKITLATDILLPSLIDGGASNDTIKGGGGNDRIYGADGDDSITANDGDDVVFGGNGNDTIIGNAGVNLLFGESGNDKLTGQGVLIGGLGDDTLNSDLTRNVLIGGVGKDILNAKVGGDLLIGGGTDFDTNESALRAIRSEWASAVPVATRISHLTGALAGGLNGSNFLVSDAVRPGTVHDDLAIDTFNNTIADDWLLLFAGDKRIRLVGNVNHV